MRSGAGRVGIVLVVALTLVASAGWLLPLLDEPAPAAATDSGVVLEVSRAIESLSLLLAVSDAALRVDVESSALMRAVQRRVIAAVSAVAASSRPGNWQSTDALLVRALELLQRLEQESEAAGRADIRLRIGEVVAGAETELAQAVEPVSADAPTPAGRTVPVLLAALTLLLGGGALITLNRAGAGAPVAAPSPVARAPVPPPSVPRAAAARTVTERIPIEGVYAADEFAAALKRDRDRAERYEHDLSLVEMTLDQSDSIRAAHGEEGLEYVIGSIAELARDNTRSSDLVGLLTSENVVVLVPETSRDRAEILAEKLRRSVSMFPFSDDIHATVSTRCTSVPGNQENDS
jgi:diguanylate cyclase (GGDEF)-like protein